MSAQTAPLAYSVSTQQQHGLAGLFCKQLGEGAQSAGDYAQVKQEFFIAAWLIGMAALTQCKHIKQLVLAAPYVSKGPLMAASTQVCVCRQTE